MFSTFRISWRNTDVSNQIFNSAPFFYRNSDRIPIVRLFAKGSFVRDVIFSIEIQTFVFTNKSNFQPIQFHLLNLFFVFFLSPSLCFNKISRSAVALFIYRNDISSRLRFEIRTPAPNFGTSGILFDSRNPRIRCSEV